LSFAYPVINEDQIREKIEKLKSEFPDATHHCFAWKLGMGETTYRSFDDGEPGNAAGKPILRQILSFGLTNVLIVVVRYFGEKKLGIPGLIQAYSKAAKMVLEEAGIIQNKLKKIYAISSTTGASHQIYELARRIGVALEIKESDPKMTFEIQVEAEMLDRFVHLCTKYPNLVVEYQL
jgi:putative IMPACT (imprinted ancient) family translation regulator